MISGTLLDVLLVVLLAMYAINGYRQGFVVSVLSLAGFLGGGALAMWAMPYALSAWKTADQHDVLRPLAVVAGVFIVASIGQALAVAIGRKVRPGSRFRAARTIDAIAGMAVVAAACAVLVWFVAGAVRPGSPVAVARAMGDSRVLQTIDKVVPPQTARLFARFNEMLDREGFPRVFEGLSNEPIAPAQPPDSAAARNTDIADIADSVIKITGIAQTCNQGQEGSGWVVSQGKVVTNAHVVAGLSQVTVRPTGVGRSYTGRVVIFDPERDLAVVDVPGLPSPAIPLGDPLASGESAVVAGFPLNGPYNLQPARVRQTLEATGSDIYGANRTTRQIYSLYATVRPGNSGGPLLDTSGEVVGIVFAKSLDDVNTGYALTLAEAEPVLSAAASASTPVSTGSCVSGG